MKINKVVTKTGDKGFSNIRGKKYSKNSIKINIFGDLDLLNSYLGLAKCNIKLIQIRNNIEFIQSLLFDIGAAIVSQKNYDSVYFNKKLLDIDNIIIQKNKNLKSISSFIIPGITLFDGYMHVSRALTRKIERDLIILKLNKEQTVIYKIINRMSDLIFILSRSVNKNIKEKLWKKK